MNKSIHKEHLSQTLQTKNKQFEFAVTFLIGYKGIFNVTNSCNNFYFAKSITDEDGLNQIPIPQSSYEKESLNYEIKRIIIDESHFTEAGYPFTIKPNFSSFGSIITIFTQGPMITFQPDDSIKDLLGFIKTTVYEENNLSSKPVDILSFDKIFLEFNIADGRTFRGKRLEHFINLLRMLILVINTLKNLDVECNGI